MPWGNTWQTRLKGLIEAQYMAAFGRELIIEDSDLFAFIKQRKLTEPQAIAHFKLVISYYKEKYSFIPKFSHLVSLRLPAVKTVNWESELYRKFPSFVPFVHTGADVSLFNRSGVEHLFDKGRAEYFHGFADAVTKTPSPVYTFKAAVLVERLVYSLARYPAWQQHLPLGVAVEAHGILRNIRVPFREKKRLWVKTHFSKTLVRKLKIPLFGYGFSFWELPKLLVDTAFAETALNCRVTQGHRDAIASVIAEYGFRYRQYLPYLLDVRTGYILRHSSDLELWAGMSPRGVPEYPF